VHYVEVARDALVAMESERLRTSLLSALSHDLRTPLTVLVALAESLALAKPPLSGEQGELAQSIRDEARRMGALVTNLLDMARLESGTVKPRLEWQPFEEVVGSALAATREMLRRHRVETRLSRDLPLVRIDAVLVERVLVNLLENASKYTPAGSTVVLAAQVAGADLGVTIADNGPGLPPGREEAVFQKFTRGEKETTTPGVGLGLTICRAIVEAHGGVIRGANRPEGGAIFTFTLPLGTPPDASQAGDEESGIDE
jgi:two-component system, OmpR family, sensor histidine kinase KdpD